MKTRTLSGAQALLIAIAFFGLIIGVNATMVTFALATFSGEDDADPYGHGLNYNQTIARRAAEKASGLAVDVAARRDTDGSVQIIAQVTQSGGRRSGLTIQALLQHPSNEAMDRPVTMTDRGDGSYAGRLDTLPVGHWELVLNLSEAKAPLLEARKMLWLP